MVCSITPPYFPFSITLGTSCTVFFELLFSSLYSLSHSLGEVPLSWPSAGRSHRRFLAHVQQGVRDLGISFPPLRSNSCKRTGLSAISAGAAAWRDAAGSQEVGHCLRGSGVRASSLSNPREGQRLFRLNCSVLAQLVCCSSFGRGRRRLRELYRARFPLRHDRGRGKGGSGGHALLGGGLVFGSRAEHQAWSTCSFRLRIFRLTRRPQFLANARHNQSMRYQTHIAQESRGRISEKLIRSFSIGVRSIGRDDATRVSRMLAAAIEAHFSTRSCFCEKGSLSDGSSHFGSSFCEG